MIDAYIRQYGRRLFGLCLTLCRQRADAEDLYQTTWLKVVESIGRYDPQRPFEPWLTCICVNTYRSRLRRVMRSPFFDRFATGEDKAAVLERAPAPEAADYGELYAAIDGLPPRLRVTVILFYFHDMRLEDVSQALNIPPGTVKSRLNKARKLIKEALRHETDLPF